MYVFQAVIFLWLFSTIAFGQENVSSPLVNASKDQKVISEKQTFPERLTIATAEFPPYEFTDSEGHIRGFSAELIQQTLAHMGISNYSQRIYPWKRALESTYVGKIMAIHSTSKNPERESKLWFPEEPLVNSAKVFVVKNKDVELLDYQTFEDLKGHTVGMIRGYNFPQVFWDYLKTHGIGYVEVTHEDQLFKMFKAGRFDFLAGEIIVIRNMIRDHQDEFTVLENSPIQIKPMYLAFSKQSVDKQWVDEFSRALRQVKQTPEYQQLCQTYQVLCIH